MPPTPKRAAERRRRNLESQVDAVTMTGAVKAPPAGRGWHPIARRWYLSLKESGQSAYYEPSDWAYAQLLADQLSRALRYADGEHLPTEDAEGNPLPKPLPGPMRASLLATILDGMGNLLTTEADRRRMRLEIERGDGEQPEVQSASATMAAALQVMPGGSSDQPASG